MCKKIERRWGRALYLRSSTTVVGASRKGALGMPCDGNNAGCQFQNIDEVL